MDFLRWMLILLMVLVISICKLNPSQTILNYSSSLTGDFRINLREGTYFGNSLTYKSNHSFPELTDYSGPATIYGSFHNEDATGISGVFFGNRNSSSFKHTGVLIGIQGDPIED